MTGSSGAWPGDDLAQPRQRLRRQLILSDQPRPGFRAEHLADRRRLLGVLGLADQPVELGLDLIVGDTSIFSCSASSAKTSGPSGAARPAGWSSSRYFCTVMPWRRR